MEKRPPSQNEGSLGKLDFGPGKMIYSFDPENCKRITCVVLSH